MQDWFIELWKAARKERQQIDIQIYRLSRLSEKTGISFSKEIDELLDERLKVDKEMMRFENIILDLESNKYKK